MQMKFATQASNGHPTILQCTMTAVGAKPLFVRAVWYSVCEMKWQDAT